MNYAIILSGGVGSRMCGSKIPKQYIHVGDQPILMYTLKTFNRNPDVDQICIVADPTYYQQIERWVKKYKINKFVTFAEAGTDRQNSIFNGLRACAKLSTSDRDKVIIHDGVRPLLSSDLISRCLNELTDAAACCPILPIPETVYQSSDRKTVEKIADRDILFRVQTPESLYLHEYLKINESLSSEERSKIRGTAEPIFARGQKIKLIPGENLAFKVTTPDDLDLFKKIALS